MKFVDRYSRAFQFLLPTPLSIAFILTLITFVAAYFLTDAKQADQSYVFSLLEYWENGLWNNGLMVFAMQMMLMLVLGHVLALTPIVSRLIQALSKYATSNSKAAALICFTTLIVAFFNWGLGLIFGAIISRKIAEHASLENIPLNYPLIGAAGYSGLMFWHGGISGSSLTKVAEEGHLRNMMQGILSEEEIMRIPAAIGFEETVFSSMNICCSLIILITLPSLMYLLGKKKTFTDLSYLKQGQNLFEMSSTEKLFGAEKIDHSQYVTKILGIIVISYSMLKVIQLPTGTGLGFITPNFINLQLIGLGLLFHRNIIQYLKAIDSAIGGASGILIQFPLYFGIMGIMKSSGLVNQLSDFFVSISDQTTFPIFTLISAGIVNIFVPSGGGQWAIQGPIIIQAVESLQISLPKSIMALAYGDQLTNMMQPFWALPLLGITQLKAKSILPYTLILMFVGGLIYLSVLLLF